LIDMDKIGRIVSLGSSSEGNAIYLEINRNGYDKPFALLLEAGFSYSELLRRSNKFNVDFEKVETVLVSHHHRDHCEAVMELIIRGVKVYAPQTVFDNNGIYTDGEFIMHEYQWKRIADGINVLPIPLEHFDVDKRVTNYGYIIKIDDDFRILFATDTKYIPQDLSNFKFDVMFVEANYLEDVVTIALKDATDSNNYGNMKRYSRLVDSHMSLENLARTLDGSIRDGAKPYDLSKCKAIFLMHLSSNKQTNTTYYKEFLKRYLMQTKEKTCIKSDTKVVILKKEGGFEL
jgi:ribonuclease BN (tRNA processing enzyme)